MKPVRFTGQYCSPEGMQLMRVCSRSFAVRSDRGPGRRRLRIFLPTILWLSFCLDVAPTRRNSTNLVRPFPVTEEMVGAAPKRAGLTIDNGQSTAWLFLFLLLKRWLGRLEKTASHSVVVQLFGCLVV